MTSIKLFSAIIFALLLFPATSLAAAPFPCDQTVFDNTGRLKSEQAEIQKQVDALKADGVDTHVIFVKDTKGIGADRIPDRMLSECENWQSADGSLAPKLLALVVSVDERRTHTRYGTALKRELDSEWLSVQEEIMAPYFRDGDFASGVAEGLKTFHSEIITPGTTSQTPSNDNRPERDPIEINGPSGESVLMFFMVVGGIGLIGFATFLTVGAVRERNRREDEQKQAISDRAKIISSAAVLQEQILAIRSRSTLVMDKTWDGEDQELTLLLSDLEQNLATSEEMMLAINETPELDPAKEFKKREAYERITRENNKVQEQLDLTNSKAQSMNDALQSFEDMIGQTPALLTEYNSLVTEANEALVLRKSEGYQISTGENLLAAASGSATNATTLESKGRVRESYKAAMEARDGASGARKWAEELPATAARLPREAAELANQLEDSKRHTVKTATDWDYLQTTYNPSCLQDLKDYTPFSERSLREVENLQREAANCATMKEQRFGDAERCLGQARGQLRDLAEVQVKLKSRREHLDALAQTLPQEATGLDSEAQSLIEYIQDNLNDLSQGNLDDANNLYADTQALVAKFETPKPDYLTLETDLATLAHAVTNHFDAVRERVAELDRLRSRARSLESSVSSSYSRTNSYMSSNNSKVKYGAKSRYQQAENEWQGRGNYDPHDTVSLLAYIALLESLDNDFDSVYSTAMSDVSSYNYDHSSSSSNSWSSGGGGGSDWGGGGFDSGGGGGSDW